MLTEIRDRATGWIAWALVILISIPFALWGINSYFEGASKIVVATVNGSDIEEVPYQRAVSERRRSLVQLMGSRLNPEYFSSLEFKNQVINSLVDTSLYAEYLDERGYSFTDEQLSDRIASIPSFHKDGVFDSERYESLIRNAGLSIEGFESQQRYEGVIDQLRQGLQQTAIVSPYMTSNAIKLLLQKRVAEYVVIDSSLFMDISSVSDEAIEKEYRENSESYVKPPQIKVQYIELSVEALADQISVSKDSVRSYYNRNIEQFTDPGTRTASHILLNVPSDASDKITDEIYNEAVEIVKLARSGSDFSELASTYSEDPGSARRGGDLGDILRGTMVPPFEQAVFSLQQDKISDPVRTEYGWHVIKVTSVKESEIKPLSLIYSKVESMVVNQKAEERFIELSQDLQNMIFEQPESLQPASDFLGLPIKKSSWFSQTRGEGVTSNRNVRESAFSEEVRVDGLNSEMLEIDNTTVVALRLDSFQEERKLSLSEVKEDIREKLSIINAREMQELFSSKLVSDLDNGADWNSELQASELDAIQFPLDLRNSDTQVDQRITRAIFSANAPLRGKITYGGTRLDPENYLVFRLDEVVWGDPLKVSEDEREQISQLISSRTGEEFFSSMGKALRASAEVTIFEDNL